MIFLKKLNFYFDFSNPQSFLLWEPLLQFCSNKPLDIYFHPVMSKTMRGHRESDLSAEQAATVVVPAVIPVNSMLALQLAHIEFCDTSQYIVIDCLFQACWAQGENISESDVLVKAMDRGGLDGYDLLTRADNHRVHHLLRAATLAAEDVGVKSVPAIELDGEVYNGMDAALGKILEYTLTENSVDTDSAAVLSAEDNSA